MRDCCVLIDHQPAARVKATALPSGEMAGRRLLMPVSGLSLELAATSTLGAPNVNEPPWNETGASTMEASTMSSPRSRTKFVLLSYAAKTTKLPSGDQSGMLVACPG